MDGRICRLWGFEAAEFIGRTFLPGWQVSWWGPCGIRTPSPTQITAASVPGRIGELIFRQRKTLRPLRRPWPGSWMESLPMKRKSMEPSVRWDFFAIRPVISLNMRKSMPDSWESMPRRIQSMCCPRMPWRRDALLLIVCMISATALPIVFLSDRSSLSLVSCLDCPRISLMEDIWSFYPDIIRYRWWRLDTASPADEGQLSETELR